MKNKCRMRFHHLVLTVVTAIILLHDFVVAYHHLAPSSTPRRSNSFSFVTSSSSPTVLPLASNSKRVSPTRLSSSKDHDSNHNNKNDNSPLSFLFNPYQSKIPKELEAEIYKAEANTPAAKDRNVRIAGYALIAFIGILCAFFNGFITELRTTETPDGSPFSLEDAGFGWVQANAVARFLFMNKIGGGIMLLGGAGAGLLAEAEYDTRRINAEKIFEELKRRKEAKEKKASGGRKKSGTVGKSGTKKRRSGKEAKRMGALAEIVETSTTATTTTTTSSSSSQQQEEEQPKEFDSVAATDASERHKAQERPTQEKETAKQGGGILDTVKNFYEKADTMAASQALLLNKKLEDAGLVEKITDETGFKVIGKEAASKLNKQNEEKSDQTTQKEKDAEK